MLNNLFNSIDITEATTTATEMVENWQIHVYNWQQFSHQQLCVLCSYICVCVFVNIGRIGKLFDGIPIIWTDALSMQKWSNILIGMSLINYALVCVHLIIRLKIDADVNNITSHHQLHSNMTSSMKFGCLFTSLLLFVFLLQFPQCEWNEIEGTRVLCISIVSSQSISFPAFMRVREEVLKFTKNFAHLLTAWIALFEHTTC